MITEVQKTLETDLIYARQNVHVLLDQKQDHFLFFIFLFLLFLISFLNKQTSLVYYIIFMNSPLKAQYFC